MPAHLAEPMGADNFVATAITISVLADIAAAFGVARLWIEGTNRAGRPRSLRWCGRANVDRWTRLRSSSSSLPRPDWSATGQWLDLSLETRSVSLSTHRIYRQHIHDYVKPHLGSVALRQLTTGRCRRCSRA